MGLPLHFDGARPEPAGPAPALPDPVRGSDTTLETTGEDPWSRPGWPFGEHKTDKFLVEIEVSIQILNAQHEVAHGVMVNSG